MDRKTVIASLKQHQAELTELGIVSLSIIGSTARQQATSTSDVDLAATLTPGPRGFAHLERIDQLRERLGKMLGCAVDVIEEPSPLPRVQQAIERDRVLAF
jgi:predicted nucleotidyltransferase